MSLLHLHLMVATLFCFLITLVHIGPIGLELYRSNMGLFFVCFPSPYPVDLPSYPKYPSGIASSGGSELFYLPGSKGSGHSQS